MPARIISRPSGNTDKVLRRSDYSREMVGLETLTETYTILSSARLSIQPSRNTLHSSFSSADSKFSRMAVETTAFREMDGDLTEMTVTYVGLTSSSGLPPAIVSLVPTTGAGIYGPPMVIQANYVTDLSEAQIISNNGSAMPSSINGTPLPDNPRAPFSTTGIGVFTNYYGYVLTNIQSIRRGLFLIVTTSYQESGSAGGTSGQSKFGGNPGKGQKSSGTGRVLFQD